MNLIGVKGKYYNQKFEIVDCIVNDIITIKTGNGTKVLDYISFFEDDNLIMDNKTLHIEILEGIKKYLEDKNYVEELSEALDEHRLHYPNEYGTSAYEIYCHLCDWLYFRDEFKENFKPRQILYAEKATEDGCEDVWFIAHSNWNSSRTSKWENYVHPNGDYIIEKCLLSYQEHENMDKPQRERVTFIKQSDGTYMFLGIYELENYDLIKKERRYKRVSTDYFPSSI